MSYSVHLYRAEVREIAVTRPDFLEREELLPAFTAAQLATLTDRLRRYGYVPTGAARSGRVFALPTEPDVSVLLTDNALFFSASGSGIFEAGMTASEFTDTGEFAKYDPQTNEWNDGLN